MRHITKNTIYITDVITENRDIYDVIENIEKVYDLDFENDLNLCFDIDTMLFYVTLKETEASMIAKLKGFNNEEYRKCLG